MTTPTDREAAIQAALLRKRAEAQRRSRARRAGLLEPLPRCQCGARCYTDRWLPLCSTCARSAGVDRLGYVRPGNQPRARRLAAEQLLAQLRAEARAEAPVTNCDDATPDRLTQPVG